MTEQSESPTRPKTLSPFEALGSEGGLSITFHSQKQGDEMGVVLKLKGQYDGPYHMRRTFFVSKNEDFYETAKKAFSELMCDWEFMAQSTGKHV